MKVYTFVRGVDGFGADIAPAYWEGAYLDYDKAYDHLCNLNKEKILSKEVVFYEDGYGDSYPKTNLILVKAEEENDWDTFTEEYRKHEITDVRKICEDFVEAEYLPYGFYGLVEVEIMDDEDDEDEDE